MSAVPEAPAEESDAPSACSRFELRRPRPPLAAFVDLLWYWRGHDVARSTERVLPMGTMELVIDLEAERAPRGGVSGPHSEAFLIERTVHDELLGIHFRPAGAFPFLACGAGDLHNRYVTLGELWGDAPAEALVDRLRAAPSVGAKFAVLEAWLADAAVRPLTRHPAVAYALNAFERDSTLPAAGRVAQEANLSQRRFIDVFRDEVGLTPKLYCRLLRFQRVLARVAAADDVDWLDAALSCGYYDQSHFIHDFREFTGLRPSEYLNLRIAGQTNHVRVAD